MLCDVINVHTAGATLEPGSDPDSVLTLITDLHNLKVFHVASPAPGLWTLSVTSYDTYTVSVTANSYVDFTFRFVDAVDGAHPGYSPVDGKPLTGESFYKMLTLHLILGQLSDITLCNNNQRCR